GLKNIGRLGRGYISLDSLMKSLDIALNLFVLRCAISPAFPPDPPDPSGLVLFLSYSAMASATRLATSLSTTLHLNRLGHMVLSTTQVRNPIRIRMISD
ncbi:hypothetical protein Tco_0396301, partial [Tanacetum coccineum]